MNSAGEIGPRSGCVQRARASAPTTEAAVGQRGLNVFLAKRCAYRRDRGENVAQFRRPQRLAHRFQQLQAQRRPDPQRRIEDAFLQAADQQDRRLEILTAEILQNLDPVRIEQVQVQDEQVEFMQVLLLPQFRG